MEDTFDGDKRTFDDSKMVELCDDDSMSDEEEHSTPDMIPTKTWLRGRWSQDRSMNVHNGNSDKDRANRKLGSLI